MDNYKNKKIRNDESVSENHKGLLKVGRPLFIEDESLGVSERESEWKAQGAGISDQHLDIFRECAINILREPDPQFELSSDKRFAASIYGKALVHSPESRKVLSESLALLGTQPDVLTSCSSGKAEEVAFVSVREIFKDADWVLWGSLNNLLPTLAEAAPDEFLNAVEDAIKKTPCPFDELFSQEGSGITGSNYMTGLLWALETLAWDGDYLTRVTVLLGKLASRDPGGNWGNRPAGSLSTIFMPWFPQTIASVKGRKSAIRTLLKESPKAAWELLLTLLPNQHQSSMGSHKPTWRKIIPDDWKKEVTNEEYYGQISSYAEIAIETAKDDYSKLNELVSNLDNLPQPYFDKLLEYIESIGTKIPSEGERTALWKELVKFYTKHKRYADAEWAIAPEMVEKIEKVAAPLEPQKPLDRYKSLFDSNAIDLFEGDWQEQENKLESCRKEAVCEIIKDSGLNAVLEFALAVDEPGEVGKHLGIVADINIDKEILPSLIETEDKKISSLVHCFIWSRQYAKGWEWVDSLEISNWSVAQLSKFLSNLPFTKETWQYAEQLLGKDEGEYWSIANVNPYQGSDDLNYTIDKLLQYERPRAAIFCLYRLCREKKPLDKSKAIDVLSKAVSSNEPASLLNSHMIVEVIKAVQESADLSQDDDLFNVEWAYLSLLTGPGKQGSPKLLEYKLATEPDFFCEIIRLLYRSKDETEPEKESTEQKKAIANNAWRLLEYWRTLPGTQVDGSFSEDAFVEWLTSVKTQCEKSGHLEVALSTIGKVLINYVPDQDELWINKTLAEALNSDDADDMRRGYYFGTINSRGVHFIGPEAKAEKELAAKYSKQANEVDDAGYFRFAQTLRDIAQYYKDDAERIIEEHKEFKSR